MNPEFTLTREEWLMELTEMLKPLFEEHGFPLPDKIRCSCGFPSKSALSKKRTRIGECWSPKASSDIHTEIFISPLLGKDSEAADVLTHELIHAAVGTECGHKGNFKKLADLIGMTGPMRSAECGPELALKISKLYKPLGTYPHAKLNALRNPNKTQGTRLLKVICDCGYTVRITKKWIEEGLPTCVCGLSMYVEAKTEE